MKSLKKMKSLLALFLIIVSVVGTMTACGDSNNSGNDGNKDKDTSVGTEKNDKSEEKQSDADLPVLTWYICEEPQADEQVVEEKLNELLLANGVQAKLDVVFQSGYEDKINMMVTAGEEFDILFTADWCFPYGTNAAKGAFMDMTELIEEYGQDVLEVIPEDVLACAKVNGKLYAIPNYQNSVAQYGYIIPNDLIEKYDLDVESIKVMEDIEPILQTIKENEPELIPIQYTTWLASARLYNAGQDMVSSWYCVSEDDKVSFGEELRKENAKMMMDWYQKGYIRSDILSVTDEYAELDAGKYAVFMVASVPPGVEVTYKNKYGKDFTCVPIMDKPFMYYSAPMSAMSAISATSKHPELAMQILNLANSNAEFYNTLCYGVEGVHYVKNEDGSITKTDADVNYNPGIDWAFGCAFHAYPLEGMEPDVYEQQKAYNDSATISPLLGFIFDASSTITERTNVVTVLKEYQVLFVGATNPDEFDAKWDEMMTKLEEAGLETVTEEIERQIADWRAAQ